MKKFFVVSAILIVSSFPASAQTCEALLQQVNKALEESRASADKKEQAQKLRDEGETQRKTGGDCQTPLSQALQVLGG